MTATLFAVLLSVLGLYSWRLASFFLSFLEIQLAAGTAGLLIRTVISLAGFASAFLALKIFQRKVRMEKMSRVCIDIPELGITAFLPLVLVSAVLGVLALATRFSTENIWRELMAYHRCDCPYPLFSSTLMLFDLMLSFVLAEELLVRTIFTEVLFPGLNTRVKNLLQAALSTLIYGWIGLAYIPVWIFMYRKYPGSEGLYARISLRMMAVFISFMLISAIESSGVEHSLQIAALFTVSAFGLLLASGRLREMFRKGAF